MVSHRVNNGSMRQKPEPLSYPLGNNIFINNRAATENITRSMEQYIRRFREFRKASDLSKPTVNDVTKTSNMEDT